MPVIPEVEGIGRMRYLRSSASLWQVQGYPGPRVVLSSQKKGCIREKALKELEVEAVL